MYVAAVGEGRGDCYQCTLDVNFNNSSVNGFSLLAPVLEMKVSLFTILWLWPKHNNTG